MPDQKNASFYKYLTSFRRRAVCHPRIINPVSGPRHSERCSSYQPKKWAIQIGLGWPGPPIRGLRGETPNPRIQAQNQITVPRTQPGQWGAHIPRPLNTRTKTPNMVSPPSCTQVVQVGLPRSVESTGLRNSSWISLPVVLQCGGGTNPNAQNSGRPDFGCVRLGFWVCEFPSPIELFPTSRGKMVKLDLKGSM